MKILCRKCGKSLLLVPMLQSPEAVTYRIMPCPVCITRAEKDGYESGHNAGRKFSRKAHKRKLNPCQD